MPNPPMEREHVLDESLGCWCHPYIVYEAADGARVFVHQDPEGTAPPLDVVAEAIVRCMEGD